MVYTAEIAREYWNLGPRIIITIQTQGGIMKIIWNQIKLVCLLTNWFVIYPNFTYYSELLFIFANSKSLFLPPKTPFFFFWKYMALKRYHLLPLLFIVIYQLPLQFILVSASLSFSCHYFLDTTLGGFIIHKKDPSIIPWPTASSNFSFLPPTSATQSQSHIRLRHNQ